MKMDELRKKSREELKEMEQKKKKEFAELYLKLNSGQLSNTNLIKEARKDIARIKTLLRKENSNDKIQMTNQIQNPNVKNN